MNFIYSKHFLERNALRNINDGTAEILFREADGHYTDMQTNTSIAVKRMELHQKIRDVSLSYIVKGDDVLFITIHPLKEGQKQNRINSGRWNPK